MDALRSSGTDSGKLSLRFEKAEQAVVFREYHGGTGNTFPDVPIGVITSVWREASGSTLVATVGGAKLRLVPGPRTVNRVLVDAIKGIPDSFADLQLIYDGGCFESDLDVGEMARAVMQKITPARIATIVQRQNGGTRLEGKNGERFGTSAVAGAVVRQLGGLITVTQVDDLRGGGVMVTHEGGHIEVLVDFGRQAVAGLLGFDLNFWRNE